MKGEINPVDILKLIRFVKWYHSNTSHKNYFGNDLIYEYLTSSETDLSEKDIEDFGRLLIRIKSWNIFF